MSKKRNNFPLILAIIALAVFLGSFILANKVGLYISPDETANAFFAKRFATTGTLQWFDPLNVDVGNALHPRSVLSIAGVLVPISFTGLPVLYGILIRFFGEGLLPFLTPLVAFGSVFALYGLCRRLFSERVALLTGVLWAIHPGWWYYSARSMMHNVLFVALLIFSVYLLIVRPFKTHFFDKKVTGFKKNLLMNFDFILSGLIFGTALFVRTSSILWVSTAFILGAYLVTRKFLWQPLVIFVVSALIALLPMFFINQSTFGNPFTFGYQVTTSVDSIFTTTPIDQIELSQPVQEKSQLRQKAEKILSPMFPFGVAPRATVRNVFAYMFSIFWWLTILGLIGLPLFFPNRKMEKIEKRKRIAYLVVFGSVFVWLGVMYGSWTIKDNPDPTAVTIANSYVRYWLPVYVMAMPFVAMGIFWLTEQAKTKAVRNIILLVLLIMCFGLSVRSVYFSRDDGLVSAAAVLERSIEIRERVFTHVEPDAVVIVDRSDKLFWPERRVLFPLRNEITYELMPHIVLRTPLYYYGITFPQKDIDYLNEVKLSENNLRISLIETFDQESLYWITPIR